MKRFWVVLLSIGCIFAVGSTAMAVTPDFAGQYYARGWYFDNPSMLDQNQAAGRSALSFVDQRLRLFWRMKIVDGVSLTTRSDWMETVWGLDQDFRTTPASGSNFNQQNMSFEQVYTSFKTAIGDFNVGYKSATPYSSWGTNFMDSTGTAPGVTWSYNLGPTTILADWFVQDANDFNDGRARLTGLDTDNDLYDIGVKTKFPGGDAGVLLSYFRYAADRTATTPTLTKNFVIQPYVRTKLGPVNLEAEGYWMGGDVDIETATGQDQDITARGLYVGARFDIGPAYIGGRFIYSSGDDPTTADELEGSVNNVFGYARDKSIFGEFNAFLFNLYATSFVTMRGDASAPALRNNLDNVWQYQVYGGISPTKKIDLLARFSYLKADEAPLNQARTARVLDKDYGYELDLKASYKIYDALTYNVGGAYLWTGDYFKGSNPNASIKDVYMLMHWIDLNF